MYTYICVLFYDVGNPFSWKMTNFSKTFLLSRHSFCKKSALFKIKKKIENEIIENIYILTRTYTVFSYFFKDFVCMCVCWHFLRFLGHSKSASVAFMITHVCVWEGEIKYCKIRKKFFSWSCRYQIGTNLRIWINTFLITDITKSTFCLSIDQSIICDCHMLLSMD